MGGLLDLTSYRMWHGGAELERLWAGGREWVRPTVVTVTGGVVTTFERGGVSFTQVLFRRSGSMHVSGPVLGARLALIGGGASGAVIGRSAGGGGAGGLVELEAPLAAGDYGVEVGAGGAGLASNAPGNAGSPSRLLLGSVALLIAPGGGRGGSNANGGDGGCGGGGGTNGVAREGGLGAPGFNGGRSVTSGGASTEGAGGGGGMGGPGLDGQPRIGGKGGPGVTLGWVDPPTDVCGGGGGKTDNLGTPGTATHGGTSGTSVNGSVSNSAINGGGSGGGAAGSGNGGDGLFVLVFPSANAKLVVIA